jgi:putative YhbY family RNA-binding protein
MLTLSPVERKALKARAHHLQPVVMIGEAGLTPAVLNEIDLNLKSHELIKIRVHGDDRQHRSALNEEICRRLGAAAVQQIGKTLVVYRPRPAEDQPAPLPARNAKRKERRRSKRSNAVSSEQ